MTSVPATFDFKSTVSDKRLRGLWRLMRGYRLIYIGALFFIGVGALMNTLTYVLLAYLIDDVLSQGISTPTIQECRDVLQKELGILPSNETAMLYEGLIG